MRRDEIIRAIEEITMALTESHLKETIGKPVSNLKNSSAGALALLESLKSYAISANKFSPAAEKIAKIIGLQHFGEPQLWAYLLSDNPEIIRNAIYEVRSDINFALKRLPQIETLIKPEHFHLINKSAKESIDKYNDKEIISIHIIEEDNRFSSPQRLIEVLESVSILYRSCAQLLALPPEGLSVIACDSGSDKSFDLLGNAKVIECLKEFILSMWDRIVYFREKQLEERIELVNKSLPVYDRIAELVKEKKLEPEMGEILRRSIFEGTSKFIKAGVTIPEIEKVSIQPPRALMSPEPKLLVSAPDSILNAEKDASSTADASTEKEKDDQTDNRHNINFAGLSDSEQVLLNDLLKKVQQGEKISASETTEPENDSEEP